jgi:cation diffusion facilitator family transporter
MTMIASGQHLLSDAYSTVGLVVGLVIIFITKEIWIDNVVALIFGGLILITGYSTVRKSIAGIMDEQDEELGNKVVAVLEERRRPNWIDLHNFRIIQYGSQLHIDCHVTVPFYLTVAEAHDAIKILEETLQEQSKEPVELFIHTDPCLPPHSCGICVKVDCPHREAPFKQRITWNYERVSLNEKHQLE